MNVQRVALLPLLLLLATPLVGRAASDVGALCTPAPGPDGKAQVRPATPAGVPALLRVPPHVSRPPIVLWHGFGQPASEQALMAQLPLDDVPAVKVYLGLPLFGARSPADKAGLAQRQARDLATQLFEPVVLGAARELPAVVAALREDGCLRADERIGLFGFSAGGAVALDALARREVPVAAAVVLNASTGLDASVSAFERVTGKHYAWSPRAREIARESDAVEHAGDIAAGTPALLIVQGQGDTMLTPEPARRLHAALAKHDPGHGSLALDLVDGMPHNISAADDVEHVRKAAGEWFNANLGIRTGA